jgi:hypothetical protein
MRTGPVFCVLAACGQPATAPSVAPRPAPVIANVAAPAPVAAQRRADPTAANAGAKTCTLGNAIVLGPHGQGHAVLAFDSLGGLAAWKSGPAAISLQAIGSDGAKLGNGTTVVVAEALEPHRAYAVGGGFVVLVRRWEWQTKDLGWYGIVVNHAGTTATAALDLQLADLDITAAQVTGDRIALTVGPGYISKNSKQPVRGHTLDIAPAGITSSPSATLAGSDPRAPDALDFDVTNGAVPPPPGRGGKIYEAMGRPILTRTLAGKRVGDPIDLEFRGNPIAHSMNISSDIAWSGTHFVYPFSDDVDRLLPIDCRP